MKYLFSCVLVLVALTGYSQNKRIIKNLSKSRSYFITYQNLPFDDVFIRVPKTRGKTKYYIKKDKCEGVRLLIQRKELTQTSTYHIIKIHKEHKILSIEDLDKMIEELRKE